MQDAERQLASKGLEEGLFLVRSKGNSFAVSVVTKGAPVHLLAEKVSGQFTINGESFGPVSIT